MSHGAVAGHTGHVHEALLYGSDQELLAGAVPFLRDGLAAGEPTVVSMGEERAAILREGLGGDARHVSFLPGDGQYSRPSMAIGAYRDLFSRHARAGARQVRVLGALPAAATAATWPWWARYEAAVNLAYDEFPVRTMCSYDTRTVRDEVLDDVRSTHPYLTTAAGRAANPGFVPAEEFLARPPGGVDPLEATPPFAELVDPVPAAARHAARDAGGASGCTAPEVRDFVAAVSEAVTNALSHGRPPVLLRLWAAADRLVATVSDQGTGPRDPLAGLVRGSASARSGVGLWFAHQSCDHVVLGNDPEAFTVRLVVGETGH